MNKAIIREREDGERLWFAGGGVWTMKATGAETDGALLMFEDRVAKGKTTPLHTHPYEDEAIYVLEGELLVHADGEERRVGPGGLFVAPRGLPHAFLVTSETAHLLCVQTPASGEPFYRAASEPSESDADADRPPDFARLREVAEQSDRIELLGPPPFAVVPSAQPA